MTAPGIFGCPVAAAGMFGGHSRERGTRPQAPRRCLQGQIRLCLV